METKFIKTKSDYKKALKRIEEIWGGFYKKQPDANEIETLLNLVEQYEMEHYMLPAKLQAA